MGENISIPDFSNSSSVPRSRCSEGEQKDGDELELQLRETKGRVPNGNVNNNIESALK